MTTWVKATNEFGMQHAFVAEAVVSVIENQPMRDEEDHIPSCTVTFGDRTYAEIRLPFNTLYEIVTRAQS